MAFPRTPISAPFTIQRVLARNDDVQKQDSKGEGKVEQDHSSYTYGIGSSDADVQVSSDVIDITQKKEQEQIENISRLLEKRYTSLDQVCEELHERFCSSDSNNWIKSVDTVEKEATLTRLRKYIDVNKSLLERKPLTPAAVVENSSALTGRFFTCNRKDKIQQRGSMLQLQAQPNVKFKNPTVSQLNTTLEFASHQQNVQFNECLSTNGWGAACNVDIGIGKHTFGAKYEYETKKSLEGKEVNTDCATYYSNVSYCILPVALWEPHDKDVSLSDEALRHLFEIEKRMSNDKNTALQECKIFFNKFGSHVYLGAVHFGGISKIETVYQTENKTNQSLVSRMVNSKHSESANAKLNIIGLFTLSMGASSHQEHGETDEFGKFVGEESSKLHTTESNLGGPQDVGTIPLWKLGLKAINSTWVVIDGGTLDIDEYTSVWELIQYQPECFKTASCLADFICETWQNLTGMQVSKVSLLKKHIDTAIKRFEQEISRMHACLQADDNSQEYVDIVTNLCSAVKRLEKDSGNTNIWKQQLQTNDIVSKFLHRVINIAFLKADEVEVRNCIEQLVAFSDNTSFSNKEKILLWLNQKEKSSNESILTEQPLHSLKEFADTLEKFLTSHHLRRCTRDTSQDCNLPLTIEFAKSVENLLSNLRNANDDSQRILLFSLLMPLKYDIENQEIQTTITVDNLQCFTSQLKTQLTEYDGVKTRENKWRQAWVLRHLFLNIRDADCDSRTNDSGDQILLLMELKVIKGLKSKALNLDKTIKALIYHNYDQGTTALLESLNCIIDGRKKLKKENKISWDYFEDKTCVCCKDQKHKSKINISTGINNIAKEDRETSDLIPDIIKAMKLSKYFPGKLSVQKALTIFDSAIGQPKQMEDLPWVILRRLISMNFSFRDKVYHDFTLNSKGSSKTGSKYQNGGNYLLCLTDSESDDDEATEYLHMDLNPLDIILAIFVCCDPFLKGVVAQKIFACQLAIPIFFQDFVNRKLTFSLWPLRSIVTTTKDDSKASVVTQATHILSFLRIGNPDGKSKSEFINKLLRDQNEVHNTFYHRDCPHGTHTRTISDGMVEVAWYIPVNENDQQTKQSKDFMTKRIREPLTIFNLRGNAENYLTQTNAILQMSSIVVLFIKYEDLKNKLYTQLLSTIHKREAFVILFTNLDLDKKLFKSTMQEYKKLTQMNQEKTCLFSAFDLEKKRERNAYEIKQNLSEIISDALSKQKQPISLEALSETLPNEICNDESRQQCVRGKELAQSIVSPIFKLDADSQRKQEVLPLQGKRLWHEWAKLQKEQYRAGTHQSDQQRDKTWKNMKTLREKQVDQLKSSQDTMARFVEILMKIIEDNETTLYFLTWLRQFLDEESRGILPQLRQSLHRAFVAYQESKSDDKKAKVDRAEMTLINASLGLEHFFREISQIYEAFIYSQKVQELSFGNNTSCLIEHLPYLAAKLLLLGQPLELMDGDAGNVPLEWTQAVFMALKTMLENKRLVSISVLGIQSSGKSTLLNTMFGLHFPVSAGRCTRGVFLQLLGMYNANPSKGPDYAMIIDTEGLRAPESAGQQIHHDNELATLVIGLADIIILNIKGETMGEMENVLQIVVHELLRLKRAHANLMLCQSAILVHQNVSAEDAASQLLQGNQKVVQNLDRVTEEAAVQEDMAEIQKFKDVIQFNSESSVKYISDLWYGSPPMAPVSTKYSSQAADVVESIIADVVGKETQFLSVSATSVHLVDLWKAILAEDFVFSFRNGLQIKAYNLLEEEFLKQKWKLEEMKMNWEKDNIQSKLAECTTEKDINKCAYILIDEFIKKLKIEQPAAVESLLKFLNSSELNSLMVEWQDIKVQRLNDIALEIQRSVQMKIEKAQKHCKAASGQAEVVKQREQRINEMASNLACTLQGKHLTKEYKDEAFQHLWRERIYDIEREVFEESQQTRQLTIKSKLETLLRERFKTQSSLICGELTKVQLDQCQANPVLVKSLDDVLKQGEFQKATHDKVNMIFKKIEIYLKELLQTDTDFDPVQFSHILHIIKSAFTRQKPETGSRMKQSLEVVVSVRAAQYAYKKFQDLSETYNAKHSVRGQLMSYKPIARQLFEDILSSKTTYIIAANSLCLTLKEIIRERIERNLQIDIQSKIRMRFGSQKHRLIREVLHDLANRENFSDFFSYISHPDMYVSHWLNELTDDIVFKKNDQRRSYYVLQACDYLSEFIKNMKAAAVTVTQHGDYQNIKEWIDLFQKQIKDQNFTLKKDCFVHATVHNVDNFDDFLCHIREQLCNIEKDLTGTFETQTPQTIQWLEISPYKAIFESLWGCTEKCPFCNEPCINSDAKHVLNSKPEVQSRLGHIHGINSVAKLALNSIPDFHRCIQHRPSGIDGASYYGNKIMLMDSCNYMLHIDSSLRCGKWCQCKNVGNCDYSHKFRQYRDYIPAWDILPNADTPSSEYWAWFMVKFSEPLSKKYNVKSPKFPKFWRAVSKLRAIESLNMYK